MHVDFLCRPSCTVKPSWAALFHGVHRELLRIADCLKIDAHLEVMSQVGSAEYVRHSCVGSTMQVVKQLQDLILELSAAAFAAYMRCAGGLTC